jgi:hypothetical protein
LKKKLGEKSSLAILITLKNQQEKWSRLLFYLFGTQKGAEVIQTGPTMISPFEHIEPKNKI